MSKVTSATFDPSGRVTLWLEGARPEEDYYPAYHNLSQRYALMMLITSGAVDGCQVITTNSRDVEAPEDSTTRRARRFAARAGLAFRDQVRFPTRPTAEAAAADLVTYAPIVAELEATGLRCQVYGYANEQRWRVVVRDGDTR
jgi:hypothetical protein